MADRREETEDPGKGAASSNPAGAPTETSPTGFSPPGPPRSAIRDAETPLERPRDSEGNPRGSSWPRQKAAAAARAEHETEPPDDDGATQDDQPLPTREGSAGKTEHTMRSMDTPTPMSRQPWDERRIGTIELEVEHLSVSVRLLEKSLERARIEARVRSLVLLVVVGVALLARVL